MHRSLVLVPVLACSVVALVACGGSETAAPATVTVTAPPAAAPSAQSSEAAPARQVTLPDVQGRNGGIVFDELTKLGLTKLQLASRDQEDKVVLNPANWTAVEIEPGPGTQVSTEDTVVVTMTKKG